MSEVKDLFRMHFEGGCQYVAKRVYNKILAVDFDSYINASRHERTSKRRGQGNGHRTRSLLTSVGQWELWVIFLMFFAAIGSHLVSYRRLVGGRFWISSLFVV